MSDPQQRVSIGFFVRRTYKRPPHDGKTMHATSRRIYPTREAADEAMRREASYDDRFDLDVTEAWMKARPNASTSGTSGEEE